jgi:hypothetical protein
MLNGKFYRFSQEGNVDELRQMLIEEKLIFETEGIVPAKIVHLDLMKLKNKLFLREFQIRLNGKGEDNCWNRKKNNSETRFMSLSTLKRLQEMCKYIPIQNICIEAEEYENDKIEMILQQFNFDSIELFVENGMGTVQIEYLKKKHHDASIQFIESGKKKSKTR